MLKADLHIHTIYSMDCNTPLEKVINRCLETGINCVAIADHGTIEGALKLRDIAPFTVIVAEEILTPQGEILGMILREGIPSGLSVEQTIAHIREQDYVVCIQHHFEPFRHSALDNQTIETILEQIDIIEAFNSRTPLLRSLAKADMFAEKYGIPKSAGSDAHTASEIGNAYVEMPEFNGKDDFLPALEKGKICGHRTNPLTHFASVWTRLRNRF